MLPDVVLLSQLETYHEDYVYYKDIWDIIAEMREGAPAILRNPAKYLPRKPGEDEDVYQSRLAKASYTPVFPNAVKKFVMSIEDSPLYLDIDEGAEQFWNDFRKKVDGARLKDRAWLSRVFSSILFFGRHYLGVDLPDTGIEPRSELEASNLNTLPYFVDFEPLQVIDFEPDVWYKTRQIVYQADPLKGRKPFIRYTLWTAEETVRYEAEVKLYNPLATQQTSEQKALAAMTQLGVEVSGSVITSIRDLQGNFVSPTAASLSLKQTKSFQHGLGRPAMVHTVLNPELWTGRECYAKQLQHTLIESGWTESGALAGLLIRLFTPPAPRPAEDTRFAYEEPTSENVIADNSHILIGQKFEFVESSGNAIQNLTLQLDKIESQINAMVALDTGNVEPGKNISNQSGAAKEIDKGLQKKACETYGAVLIDHYQQGLTIAAELKAIEPPTASGLDKFETQNLDKALEQTGLVSGLPVPPPATAMRLWYSRLVELMVGDVSDEDREAIENELAELFKPELSEGDVELSEDELTTISEALGLPVEELIASLGVGQDG